MNFNAIRQKLIENTPFVPIPWMASDKKEAEKSFDAFIDIYEAKYPKAVECLKKDRDVLLTFYDFPAEHWRHNGGSD